MSCVNIKSRLLCNLSVIISSAFVTLWDLQTTATHKIGDAQSKKSVPHLQNTGRHGRDPQTSSLSNSIPSYPMPFDLSDDTPQLNTACILAATTYPGIHNVHWSLWSELTLHHGQTLSTRGTLSVVGRVWQEGPVLSLPSNKLIRKQTYLRGQSEAVFSPVSQKSLAHMWVAEYGGRTIKNSPYQ